MISFTNFIQLYNERPSEFTVITWPIVTSYRLLRLQESDIAVIRYTEQGLAVPAEWLAYRQALRDITTTFPDPESVVFPDPPDVTIPPVVTSQEERLEAAELMIDLLLETQEGA
jgi:hypothetical protein